MAPNDAAAAAKRLEKRCESTIERIFYRAAWPKLPGLIPQYQLGRVRLDFAIPALRVAIETDGYGYHHTREQLAHDLSRQRYIMRHGWIVIRFSGTEIKRAVGLCVSDAVQIIESIFKRG